MIRFRTGKSKWNIFHYCIGLVMVLLSHYSFAATIVIAPNTVISANTTYSNDTLDMSNGSFIINNNASLTIENCAINGTVSPANPFLINVSNGALVLNNNMIQVTASGITPAPQQQSLYQVLRVDQGTVNMAGNTASVDMAFTVGFLLTNQTIMTDGFNIINNTFKNFHGGLYLINSNHAEIDDNHFVSVSYANIFNIGNMSNIKRNQFLLPGNFVSGDTIDILSSDGIVISDNTFESGSCVEIAAGDSQNILIDGNKMMDGLTYAIAIGTEEGMKDVKTKKSFLSQMRHKYKSNLLALSNITITNNYISQNRYGLTAAGVDHFIVQNNLFIQRFMDDKTRKFWTDNAILLSGITNLTWTNNFYKEAYSQINGDDNTKSKQVVPFPQTGGVTL